MEKAGIASVWREIDKDTGRIATYVCKRDVEDRDLHLCSIRARCNPELRYYAIRTCVADNQEYLEDVLSLLKRRNLTDEAVERYGGIVRL